MTWGRIDCIPGCCRFEDSRMNTPRILPAPLAHGEDDCLWKNGENSLISQNAHSFFWRFKQPQPNNKRSTLPNVWPGFTGFTSMKKFGPGRMMKRTNLKMWRKGKIFFGKKLNNLTLVVFYFSQPSFFGWKFGLHNVAGFRIVRTSDSRLDCLNPYFCFLYCD